ncbi:hypothetical protein [Corynebacterium striatum]|uniref:hypothetical protein n=1 Tax=Corynebacterium striatum TaxID=43770 RepID=UPI0027B9E244|nr:hypothetical protein [Corynebacterium striatum]
MNRELTISTATTRTSGYWNNQLTTKQDLTARIYEPIQLEITQDEYQALPKAERDKAKDHGGYVLGHLRGGRRRKGHVHNRSAITLDVDSLPAYTNLPQVLQDNLDCAWLAHTTTSHTPDQPRWRVIIWLSRNVTPDEYTALARRAAQDINPGLDWFDHTTYQPERFMYWPAATTDGDYQAHVSHNREDLDVDAWLSRYTDETEFEANNVNPLHTPAGTPFLATVCGGLPQLVVRSHSDIDLEAWWLLNGTRWLRTDDCDVEIITPLKSD